MAKRLRELDTARDTIKALRANVTHDALDSYISTKCPISDENRSLLNFSSEKESEAGKVREIANQGFNVYINFWLIRSMREWLEYATTTKRKELNTTNFYSTL